MRRIYDFSRAPSTRNYTIADLKALKGSSRKLSMSNPANVAEVQACVEAGIDLLVVWESQIEEVRRVAPHHFAGVGSTWAQFGSAGEIMDHAFDMMRKGGDMYYTLRSYDVMEMLAKEGIPVQSHIGLIPTFSHYCGGLRGWGRTAEEAMEIYRTLKRMEDVGVFSVEAECIAEEVLEAVNQKRSTKRPRSSPFRWGRGWQVTSSCRSWPIFAVRTARKKSRRNTRTPSATYAACMSKCMKSGSPH
jgi:3-methyl-2-oxobutanoate hydroxymethyltransferase